MEEQAQGVPAPPPPPAQVQAGQQAPTVTGISCPTCTAGTAISPLKLV